MNYAGFAEVFVPRRKLEARRDWIGRVVLRVLLFLFLTLIIVKVVRDPNAEYYPDVKWGPFWLPGNKMRQIIGYAEDEGSAGVVYRLWHENGQLYENSKAYDKDGHEVPLLASGQSLPKSWRRELAFYRRVITRWDEQGRKTFENEIRDGLWYTHTIFWPENGRVRCKYRLGLNADRQGDEFAYDIDGNLVFHGRWGNTGTNYRGEWLEQVYFGDVSYSIRGPE